jgi:hypothetical protein
MSAFENIFGKALYVTDCRWKWQVWSARNFEVSTLPHFTIGLGSGKMLEWMKSMWLWLVSCWWGVYKRLRWHTERTICYSITYEVLPLERWEVISKFIHISDNSTQNESQGPPKLFNVYPFIQHLNNMVQNLVFQSKTLWQMSPWLCGKVICLSDNTYP